MPEFPPTRDASTPSETAFTQSFTQSAEDGTDHEAVRKALELIERYDVQGARVVLHALLRKLQKKRK